MRKIIENDTTSLGECIRRERKKSGLTQGQLGERIGLRASRVSKIEKGAPISLETASFILGKMGSKLKLNVVPSTWDRDSTGYIMSCVYHYSKFKKIPLAQSYRYLKTFKGIDYLSRYMQIEQTLSFEEVSHNLSKVCVNNGGSL